MRELAEEFWNEHRQDLLVVEASNGHIHDYIMDCMNDVGMFLYKRGIQFNTYMETQEFFHALYETWRKEIIHELT